MTDTPLFLISREEMDMIKNDCAYPDKQYCEGCKYAGDPDDTRASEIGCTFKGANALMDEVLQRPLSNVLNEDKKKLLDDLCNLFRWTNKEGNFRPWNIGHIEQVLRTYKETIEANHE